MKEPFRFAGAGLESLFVPTDRLASLEIDRVKRKEHAGNKLLPPSKDEVRAKVFLDAFCDIERDFDANYLRYLFGVVIPAITFV